jgi:hypothetical protein
MVKQINSMNSELPHCNGKLNIPCLQ